MMNQSIYSFKHAHPEGIREFTSRNPGCESIEFDECRRCPTTVVDLASSLISYNGNRILGDLEPFAGNDCGEVKIIQWPTLSEEVEGIAKLVQSHLDSGLLESKDVLILTPRRRIGYKIRDHLSRMNIDVKSYFRENALDSEAAKIAFSTLNLIAYPDDRVALRYVLGHGNSNYRQKSYKRLMDKAIEEELTVRVILEKLLAEKITIPHASNVIKIYNDFLNKKEEIMNNLSNATFDMAAFFAPHDCEDLNDLRSS